MRETKKTKVELNTNISKRINNQNIVMENMSLIYHI